MKNIIFLLFSIATFGQVSTGQETPFDYGIQNTAAQLVGNSDYIVTQGNDGTYGKYLFNLNQIEKKQYLATGLIKNGLLTANGDPTKYNISAGIGIITNYDNPEIPTSTIVNFGAIVGHTPAYLTTANITYMAINSSGALVEQASPFTASQRRSLILIGAAIHSNLTTINSINNISAPTNADTNQLHDFMEAVGALNISGNKFEANGANLQLNKTAGKIFKLGINFANDWKDPHSLLQGATTALTFRYRTQNGTEGLDITSINPAVYDLNNVLTAVPSNKFSIQTVTIFQTGIVRIQYGQSTYATLSEAEAAIFTRIYTIEPNIAANGITRAYIIVKNTTTSLQNVSDSKIVEAGKFGSVGGGGGAVTLDAIVAALGFTPENVANKTSTLTASAVLYPNNNAVIDGLATKQNTISGTANVIPKYGTGGLVGSNISDNGTNVGVKTTTPIFGLDVQSVNGIRISTSNFTSGSGRPSIRQDIFDTTGGFVCSLLELYGGNFTGAPLTKLSQIGAYGMTNSGVTPSTLSYMYFGTETNVGYNNNTFRIYPNKTSYFDGNVGIGTTSPLAKLVVNSGELLVNTNVNNGADKLQVNGSILGTALKLSTTPTTSASTYDILTRNSTSGVVEKKLDSDFVHTTGNEVIGGVKSFSSGSIKLYDTINLNYQSLLAEDSGFYFKGYSGNNLAIITSGTFNFGNVNFSAQYVLANRTYSLPNTSGTIALVETIKPYKVYTALMTQTGTSAPTVKVLQNDIGAIVWTRSGVGSYVATLTGAFTADKTTLTTTGSSVSGIIAGGRGSANTVLIATGTPTALDGLMTDAFLEIRVYN